MSHIHLPNSTLSVNSSTQHHFMAHIYPPNTASPSALTPFSLTYLLNIVCHKFTHSPLFHHTLIYPAPVSPLHIHLPNTPFSITHSFTQYPSHELFIYPTQLYPSTHLSNASFSITQSSLTSSTIFPSLFPAF